METTNESGGGMGGKSSNSARAGLITLAISIGWATANAQIEAPDPAGKFVGCYRLFEADDGRSVANMPPVPLPRAIQLLPEKKVSAGSTSMNAIAYWHSENGEQPLLNPYAMAVDRVPYVSWLSKFQPFWKSLDASWYVHDGDGSIVVRLGGYGYFGAGLTMKLIGDGQLLIGSYSSVGSYCGTALMRMTQSQRNELGMTFSVTGISVDTCPNK